MNNDVDCVSKGLQARVESILSAYHARGFFPSACVRVFTGTQTLCTACIGDARPDTVFDLASLTKIATATQVLMLVDAGRIRLEDRIVELIAPLAEDALLRSRLEDVTVQKLLTHTSGIVDWYPFYAHDASFERVLHIALERYGPVEGMVYSDLNFMLLGKLVERIVGTPLDACLQASLVDPLQLGRMGYRPDPDWDIAPSSYGNPIEEAMCAARQIDFAGWRPHAPVVGTPNDGNAYYYFGGVAGSAGLFADAAACERLCQYHLTACTPIISRAQSQWAPTRGLGWQLDEKYPDGCGHTGFTGTSLYIARKHDIGVVALTNRLFYPHENPNPTNDFRKALHLGVLECLSSI